ncbi:MAG TPA: family 1 glycosylhydrolase [Marmoricola sp.]
MTAPRPRLFAPGTFTWALGIEDTCVYPRPADDASPLDEHVLTEHDVNWYEDLTTVRALGATAVRYGASWPVVHMAPGRFDWDHLDRAADAARELGLSVIVDLVHYGCPPWLAGSFSDPGFAGALAEFAGALAHRYRGRIDYFTPVNEPLTTASFSGLRGVWPPYGTGWHGWVDVTVNIARGVAAAERAIRAANPDALIVHVEATALHETARDDLLGEVDHLAAVSRLPLELALGRVDVHHPMRDWLIEHGARDSDLTALVSAPATPDVLGVNYYPDLTPRTLVLHEGQVTQIAVDRGAGGLEEVLSSYAQDYRLPLAITETSVEGTDEVRSAWLRSAARTVARMRRDGLDIRGFTWWPLLDFVDWSYAAGGANVEEFLVPDASGADAYAPLLLAAGRGLTPADFLRRMGLVRLEPDEDGQLGRVVTSTAAVFSELASDR